MSARLMPANAILSVVLFSAVIGGAAVIGARKQVERLEQLPSFWMGGGEPSAAIILQPEDCAGMTEILNRLSFGLERIGVPVQGLLAVNRNSGEADGVVSFPLSRARAADLAAVMRALGITTTPVVVLADGLGRVRYLAPLAPDLAAVEAEASRIISVVQELRSEGGVQ